MIQRYSLGCPIWASKDWVGSLYTKEAKPKHYLSQYAQVFNTIEGNHTFYGLPSENSVKRWNQETPDHFRFCFKFPQQITHHYKLLHVEEPTQRFFQILKPLESKIGILFLQLPPTFNKTGLPVLKKFLQTLPKSFHYAVEVRHDDFYESSHPAEQELNDLLSQFQMNRAIFDTVTLHAIETQDARLRDTQSRKPKMKEYFTATGKYPFMRFVGHETVEPNEPRIHYLAKIVAQWIQEKRHPYIFMHTPPEDQYAPQLCRKFHEVLLAYTSGIGTLPPWPGEQQNILPPSPQQKTLFS